MSRLKRLSGIANATPIYSGPPQCIRIISGEPSLAYMGPSRFLWSLPCLVATWAHKHPSAVLQLDLGLPFLQIGGLLCRSPARDCGLRPDDNPEKPMSLRWLSCDGCVKAPPTYSKTNRPTLRIYRERPKKSTPALALLVP